MKKQIRKAAKKKIPAKKISVTAAPRPKGPLVPLGDRVVVRPLSPEELGTTTASGIIIPDTAKEKPEQGTVVAVGPGKWNEKGDARVQMEVKAGDRVMFSKYGFDEVKVGGETYFVISESNVLAIINK